METPLNATRRPASGGGKRGGGPSAFLDTHLTTTTSLTWNDERTLAFEEMDVLSCDDEEFVQLLDFIKEMTRGLPDPQLVKKKGGKGQTKRQMAKIQEDLVQYKGSLAHGKRLLSRFIGDVDDKLSSVRRDEVLLCEYYRTLDQDIKQGEKEWLPKGNLYHHKLRKARRAMPRQRYSNDREFLEGRREKLQALRQEMEVKMRTFDLDIVDAAFAAAGNPLDMNRNYGMGDGTDVKLDVDNNSDNTDARMQMLQLVQKMRDFCVVPPAPRSVQSRLRRSLILPFSARVLALKLDDGNNAGERFVEWYVNTVIDPLAMAQLVELVPPEYLVTTTVRLMNACDSFVDLKQTRAFPDVLHVILEAIAGGRSDAFASLVLSPSNSFMRAPENREHVGVIFFAALITGQMEVVRRLMMFGFYNTNALIVWLFLNPNSEDPGYATYVAQIRARFNKHLGREMWNVQDTVNEHSYLRGLEDLGQLLLHLQQSEEEELLPIHGMCEKLRRFLGDRKMVQTTHMDNFSMFSTVTAITLEGTVNNCQLEDTTHRPISPCSSLPPVLPQAPTTTAVSVLDIQDSAQTSTPTDVSFSRLLNRKKLDILRLLPVKCAVLPAVSTSFMRRVDAWGYTPLKATTSHLFLVGDTSTANVHTVRLPPRHVDMWPDDDSTGATRARWQRIRRQMDAKQKALSFYYEAHISLKFLLSGVPLSTEAFDATQYDQQAGHLRTVKDMPHPLQTSTVFVGWCSEERVAAADGRTPQPPLGSDCHSIGISFDVLHRSRAGRFTEEIILQPRKHTMGRSTVYVPSDETPQQAETLRGEKEHKERGAENPLFPLLRLRLEVRDMDGEEDVLGSSQSGLLSLPVRCVPPVFQNSLSSADFSASTTQSDVRETVVPVVEFVNPNSDNCLGKALGGNHMQWSPGFAESSAVLTGLSVYNSQALVVGCHVDFGTQRASFTVNKKSLGTAFTVLPSTGVLRPAVSLQSSNQFAAHLQRVNPLDAVIVRFVFEKAHMLISQKTADEDESLERLQTPQGREDGSGRETRKGRKGKGVEEEEEDQAGENRPRPIPGFVPIPCPVLFNKSMADCAFLKLISCTEFALPTDDLDGELLQGDGEVLSLGPTLQVTALRVRQMLNARSCGETMLFFPPVFVRRRSDHSMSETNRVAVIPEDVSLVPLCIALTQRQRVLAYRIALHPFTDFQSTDADSIHQRRMALLAATALGYVEILYVLLERMFIFESLTIFALRISKDHPDYLLTGKKLRVFYGDECRQISSATVLQRFEYTPLHCAILEGHHECVHLLLYYLNRVLSEECRRHAVNVLTRSGETALLMACRLGYTKIAKRLLALGASPSSFDRVTRTNCLELACASRSEEIALELLRTSEYKSPVAVNIAGVASPLCWCALNNIGSLVRPLLMHGADLNVTLDGLTPLLLAVTFGSTQAALELLRCSDVGTNVTTSSSSAPRTRRRKTVLSELFADEEEPSLPVIDVDMLDPFTRSSALHVACELGQFDVATELIGKGASLNLQNKAKYANPLQVAIMHGNEKIALEILEYAKARLRRGFNVLDIAAIEKGGNTALHLAAQAGMLSVIEYIMSQFNDDEITRLSSIHKFAKLPNSVSLTATNRQGRTPLLSAIYAHQEAAAQLIASLLPASLPNPGGPVVEGTCVAILASDAEGLDSVTLFFLSQPRYVVTETFSNDFFARYNAKRREMDLKEDISAKEGVEEKPLEAPSKKFRMSVAGKSHRGREGRQRRHTHQKSSCLSSALKSRTSLSPGSYAEKLCNVTGVKRPSLTPVRKLQKRSSCTMNQRRCSTFMQMLVAKGGTGLVTRTSVQILERGFPIEELYVMVDIIFFESTRTSQSVNAMLYAETIICFLREYSDVCIASSDAIMFVRQLHGNSQLKVLDGARLEDAKRRLSEMRPLCREFFYIIRTRGKHAECVEDMRQMIAHRGVAGLSLSDELSSPFGITVLQLAATLGLSHVCQFFLYECGMDPLHVPPKSNCFHTASKWFLTPFRLALHSLDLDTVSVFLSSETSPETLHRQLEHREVLDADALQQTALQELLSRPLDMPLDATSMCIMNLMRLLIQSGAVVQGNFDAEGNDAWMLAVRASPGRGIHLQIFLDERVPFDVEEEVSDQEGGENNTAGMSEDFKARVGLRLGKSGGPLNVPNGILPLDGVCGSISKEPTAVGVDATNTRVPCLKQETYLAQLIFLCAEHNPQSLVSLLQQYPDVLSLSATHPETGDTLLLFLLRKATSIYLEECGSDALSVCETSKDTALHLTSRVLLENETTKTADTEATPYRDPLTISSVRSLLIVVEKLLRRFHFGNLYYMCPNGETALMLAASLSHISIVSLIIRQEAIQFSGDVGLKMPRERSVNANALLGIEHTLPEKREIKSQLVKNLEVPGCWKTLATRLYYPEEEMETLLTILHHFTDVNIRHSFLSMVYSNLHPIVALRIAVLYAKDVKLILMHPEAVNAFWSNVLYAQYVGRFEEVAVTPAQWSSLLSVLLPTASAVPIYLIKTTPSLPLSSPDDLLPAPLKSLLDPVDLRPEKKEDKADLSMVNWKAVVRRTKQYVRQLAAAAVCTASPASVISAAHGGGVIPSSQRHVLMAMTNHFHEIIELSVRFDNSALLNELMSSTPEELQAGVKYEWRGLMEKHSIDVIAVAAGSTSILRFLANNAETSTRMNIDRYDRIDPNSGLSEDAAAAEDAFVEAAHAAQQGSTHTRLASSKRTAGGRSSISSVTLPQKSTNKASSGQESKASNKKSTENKQAVVNLFSLESKTGSTNTENIMSDEESLESRLQYTDVMTAARERPTVSAVTWGIGAAARPIALQGGVKSATNTSTTTPHVVPLVQLQKTGGKSGHEHSVRLQTPRGNESILLSTSARQKTSVGEVTRRSISAVSRVTVVTDQRERVRYFPFYLCDWALHATLLLHAPRPSSKTIDTLLYLMDQRAPLTASVVHLFLAASRPLNNWTSSDGRLLTLNYATRTHMDTILHLLVQNNQFQLVKYFLPAALCYFAHYQHDPLTKMPPQFPLLDLPQAENHAKFAETVGKGECIDAELAEEDGMYPAVFIRSMVRVNKHGLTPFDYAHGPMVSLLMEYGCVPPSYRTNPRGFCRSIRLHTGPSAFHSVPRLMLVTPNFLELHDEGKAKSDKKTLSTLSKDVADAVIARNQAISQRTTRRDVLPSLLTNTVSLLHLGLCSADDELVLQSINEKRQKQVKTLMETQTTRLTDTPSLLAKHQPSFMLDSQRTKNPDILKLASPLGNAPTTQSSNLRGKNETGLSGLLKLLETLSERGFVTFPLVLALEDENGRLLDDSGADDGTAILLSMTLMTLAQCAGAVKREERAQSGSSSRKPKKRNSADHNLATDQASAPPPVPPRYTPAAGGKSSQPAELLEAWVASRRTAKQNAAGKDPHMHVLAKAVGTGVLGRSVRVVGLSTAPSYERSE